MTTQLGPITDFALDEPTPVTFDGEAYLAVRRAQTPGFAGIKAPGWSRRLIAMGKSPAPLTVLTVSVRDGQVVVDG
jgi:hypothetical protein